MRVLEYTLTEDDAAYHLGITKELLYAYVKNAPKKHLGHSKQLKCYTAQKQILFAKESLDEWDKYLREPWSIDANDRPKIPTYIKEYLKIESGGKCARCGKGNSIKDAHIEDYAFSLSHHHHNIIRLCSDCHDKFDEKIVPIEEIEIIKNRLVNEIKLKNRLDKNGRSISLYQPPNPHSVFTGRQTEINILKSAIENYRTIFIQGLGGIGKTQLALNILKEARNKTIIWLSTESIISIDALKLTLASAIQNIFNVHIDSSKITEALYDIDAVIVFDGLDNILFEKWDEVSEFICNTINNTPLLQILVTSQVDFSNIDTNKFVFTLSSLDFESGAIILESITRVKIEEKHLKLLLEYCDGHPLAIKLTAALINYYGKSEIVLMHLNTTTSLVNPSYSKHTKYTSLELCLTTAYLCFDEKQKELLIYCAFFPAGCKVVWLELGRNKLDLYGNIAKLKSLFFVDAQEDNLGIERLYMLNPIQKYVITKAQEEFKDKALKIQKEVIQYNISEAAYIDSHHLERGNKFKYGIARMECDIENYNQSLNFCKSYTKTHPHDPEYLKYIVLLASSLGKYLFLRGFFKLGIQYAKEGIEASIITKEISSAATQYHYLFQIQSRQYDLAGQEETVAALEKLATAHKSNMTIKLNLEWCKGMLANDKKETKVALLHLNRSKAILEEEVKKKRKSIKLEVEGNLALVTAEIGKTHEVAHNYLEALKYYSNSLVLQNRINDQTNIPSIHHHIGNCYSSLNDYKKAIEHYQKALEGFIASSQVQYAGNTITELGRIITNCIDDVLKYIPLTEQTLKWVLSGFEDEIINYCEIVDKSSTIKETFDSLPETLVGKFFFIVKLISFTPVAYILFDWNISFSERFNNSLPPTIFSCMLNLSKAIGYTSEVEDINTNKAVYNYILQNALLLNGPDLRSKTRVFYWLSDWFKFKGFHNNITPEELLYQAYKLF